MISIGLLATTVIPAAFYARHRYRKAGNYTIRLGVTAKNDATPKVERFKAEKIIIIRDKKE